MSDTQHRYVADHYAPRASTYVTSAVHSGGPDLDQIAARLGGLSYARVLDLGCGGGHVSYAAAPHVREVMACDLTADMLAEVKRTAQARGLGNIAVEQAAAEKLPFEDGAFDAVLCRFTAHHWHDVEAGLREARRVLKPAGFAIFIDVISPEHPLLDTHLQTLELLRDPSHVRNYTGSQWSGMLARAGFAPSAIMLRKLRMEFEVWHRRTRTPDVYIAALRGLQAKASRAVKEHFAVAEDGSFDLDTMTVEVLPVTV